MSSENTMMAQISLCRNGPSRSGNVRAGRLVCALPIGASVAGWRLRCRLVCQPRHHQCELLLLALPRKVWYTYRSSLQLTHFQKIIKR